MKTKKYLLDTNICISMLKNKYGVRETILKVNPENCYVSEITLICFRNFTFIWRYKG